MPAEWLARCIFLMLRWVRRSGIISRKTGMRSWRGTGVVAPKPGLVIVNHEISDTSLFQVDVCRIKEGAK